jgi:steroid delta-isomerase-like uncharacterized protein
MSLHENKTIARRYFEEVLSEGNLALLDELAADDMVDHAGSAAGWLPGRAGFKQHVTLFRTAFPDLRVTVDDMVAEGDTVVAFWTVSGTHNGEWWGVPATGKHLTITAVSTIRIENGQIAEYRARADRYGALLQLGVVAAPAQAAR